MNESEDPLLVVLEAYKAAVRAKSVDAFLAIYADDLHVFDMWGQWSLRGIERWRSLVVEWFSSLGDEYVVVAVDEAEATRVGEIAVGHAILTYTAHAADGREIRSLNNRLTVAMRRAGGAWKIFHEHTSAPIDHASAKAMLRRNR
jgi:ketosteroid isomerase-like protein